MGTENKVIIKNTVFLYLRVVLILLVSLYMSRVILEQLGASDYGIYNVVGGIVTIMAFLNSGLSASTSRFLTYELGVGNVRRLEDTFSASFSLHVLIGIIVLLCGETIGLWYVVNKMNIPEGRELAAFWVFQFSIVTTVVGFIQVPYTACIISHENMSVYAYVGLYEALSRLAIAYLISYSLYDKLIIYSLLLAANSFLVLLFYLLYAKRHYIETKLHVVRDKQLYGKLLSYSGWDLFGALASVSQGQGVNVILNLFFSTVINAARAVVMQIQSAVTIFVQNFLTAVRPQVIKSFAESNYERMYNLTFYAAKYSFLIMLAMALPLCFEVDFVLHIWLGEHVPDSTPIFAILTLITCVMSSIHSASLMAYHAIGRIKTGNIIGGTIMILILPVSYWLFSLSFPAYSVFIVILIGNILQQLTTWIIIYRYINYSRRSLVMIVYIPCTIIAILSLVAPYLTKQYMMPGISRFVLLTIITEIVLLLLIYSIGLDSREQFLLKAFLKDKVYARIRNSKWH